VAYVPTPYPAATLTIELVNGHELVISEATKYFDKVIDSFSRAESRVSKI
jgi:hypothetical protein